MNDMVWHQPDKLQSWIPVKELKMIIDQNYYLEKYRLSII